MSVFFALLLLAGLATGIREIYYGVFVLGLLLILTLAMAFCGVFSLRAAQSLPDRLTVRGEGARIQIRGRLCKGKKSACRRNGAL